MDEELKNELVSFFLSQPYAKPSINGKQIMFKCPFCHDPKSVSSVNFSVSIDTDSKSPWLYQCFRSACGVRGYVNQEFLERMGYSKYDVMINLAKYNRRISKYFSKSNNIFMVKQKKRLVNVVNVENDKINQIKLKYINDRLGLSLSYADIYNLKINLDSNHLLNFNEIQVPYKMKQLYSLYGSYGISFISAYNDYVIVRDISKTNKLPHRYNNINVFDKYDNVTKYYAIPGKINILSTQPTILNVAEGAMDILGVYNHLDIDREYENQIFAAACGAGIVNLIKHYIREYALTNIKINIFSDNDVKIKSYYSLCKLKPYLDKFDVTVYYNTMKKDFGVRADEIKYTITKL